MADIDLHMELKTWSVASSGKHPSRRSFGAVTVLEESRAVVLFGGQGPHSLLNDLYFLNLDKLEWVRPTTTGTIPSPRSGCSMSEIERGKVVMWGGQDKKGQKLNDVWLLDLGTMMWREMPVQGRELGKHSHSAGVGLRGKGVMVHGGKDTKDETLPHCFLLTLHLGFSSHSLTYSLLSHAMSPGPALSHHMGVHSHPYVYVCGGLSPQGPSTSIFRLCVEPDPVLSQWEEVLTPRDSIAPELGNGMMESGVLINGEIWMFVCGQDGFEACVFSLESGKWRRECRISDNKTQQVGHAVYDAKEQRVVFINHPLSSLELNGPPSPSIIPSSLLDSISSLSSSSLKRSMMQQDKQYSTEFEMDVKEKLDSLLRGMKVLLRQASVGDEELSPPLSSYESPEKLLDFF